MSMGFFPTLLDKPEKIRFTEQEENEVIELFLRRHFATNFKWIFGSLIAFFAPVLLVNIAQQASPQTFFSFPQEILIGIIAVYYMLILAFVIQNFLFWYYNIYIVTNLHLVDVNFHSILSREILEIELNDIESVSSNINGVVASLYNYGNVIIKTAAAHADLVFDSVPRPDFVADRIQDLRTVFINEPDGS